MKTYKLKSEFCDLKKGTEITIADNCIYQIIYKGVTIQLTGNEKELLEEVIEKDYEILSFIGTGNLNKDIVYELKQHGFYCANMYYLHTLEEMSDAVGVAYENNPVIINAIKRLSDGEVFTLGDIDSVVGVIKKFYTGTYNSQKHMMFFNKGYSINSIKKAEQPLFTTEDGVGIFEGDDYYYFVVCEVQKHNCGWSNPRTPPLGKVQFSKKEVAEQYILMNKPYLSINEILNEVKPYNSHRVSKLIELVKSKIK